MSVVIDLYQFRSEPYDTQAFQELAYNTITATQLIDLDRKNVTISVACVGEEEITRVNTQLRQKDETTDVISVGEYSDDQDITCEENVEIFLGEIILCYNYIEQYTQAENLNTEKEFYTAFVHGILHLLGYKHGEEMFQLQDRISENYLMKKRPV